MEITERVSDRTQIDGVNTTVEIEVEQISGPSQTALEVAERIEMAVKDEIDNIADDQEGDDG